MQTKRPTANLTITYSPGELACVDQAVAMFQCSRAQFGRLMLTEAMLPPMLRLFPDWRPSPKAYYGDHAGQTVTLQITSDRDTIGHWKYVAAQQGYRTMQRWAHEYLLFYAQCFIARSRAWPLPPHIHTDPQQRKNEPMKFAGNTPLRILEQSDALKRDDKLLKTFRAGELTPKYRHEERASHAPRRGRPSVDLAVLPLMPVGEPGDLDKLLSLTPETLAAHTAQAVESGTLERDLGPEKPKLAHGGAREGAGRPSNTARATQVVQLSIPVSAALRPGESYSDIYSTLLAETQAVARYLINLNEQADSNTIDRVRSKMRARLVRARQGFERMGGAAYYSVDLLWPERETLSQAASVLGLNAESLCEAMAAYMLRRIGAPAVEPNVQEESV